ncbi:DgyrCDS5458 [Dimorphilus gyrociliatus]|uniref:Dihydropteridine reductase n=1 Tax=Dimorphilus gyrociliatus TaxID=2664684 RepID=A0A7I8VML7_9ANNE|nr:DgyrCDS5458 [Dimorphilus gyrociliatus]
MAASISRVVVYGGKGALGREIVGYFKQKSWWVGSIDIFGNDEANANFLINPELSWTEQNESINNQVSSAIGDEKLDAIVCVAGGWAGGNAASKDLVKNSDLMWKQSVWTSIIAAGLASNYLKVGGMLTLTGAKAALESTPGMIGYGMAKAAVHQLVASLSDGKGGLPENSCVAAILPITLDTPMNRKFMPKADTSTWTPLDFVAKLLYSWSTNVDRPISGSLMQLETKDGKTELKTAKM